ncbi:MAG: hypothetical protein CVV44_04395 [Spirochaetae bacterium HGW-Spirochaetae-1]|jgi:hypothetical protein|nr:MAG: hypothetical protein CVV44_04395 [Spirochaetae bacterium HGW-Spirochaetae-1]
MNSKPEETPQIKNRNLFFSVISLFALILVPLFILFTIMYAVLTSSLPYVSLLKNARLVETFIHAKNWQMEEQIKEEIEQKVHLEEYKVEFKRIKADYDSKQAHVNAIQKVTEYDTLKKQRKELARLSWKKAPGIFNNENEFKQYKDDELQQLDIKIDAIEKYRDQNEDEIERARDEFSDAEDAFDDAMDTMEDKEEEAQDIIKSHKNSFMGKIYSDIEIISPPLTEELNQRFISVPVKREIEKFLYFMTHYEKQVENGNVYRDGLNLSGQGLQDTLKVRIPGFEISLWVEDEKNGIPQKRHLLSEVFVDKIDELENLKNRTLLANLFRFSDSGLAERFSRSYLKKARLTIDNGIIAMEKIELSGTSAEKMEVLMKVLTWGKYAAVGLPVLALCMILFIIFSSAERERKIRSLKRIFIYPGVLMIGLGVIMAGMAFNINNILPDLFASPFVQIYMKRIFLLATLHVWGPVVAVFVVLAITGSFLKTGISENENKSSAVD